MRIIVGADHHGYELRQNLLTYLKNAGYNVVDDGDNPLNPNDDYPVFAGRVVADMLASDDDDARGILICGSGQGMCMAANRFKGIRACLGYDQASIQSSRNDDDANILCLPADNLTKDKANILVETFLNTDFADAPRYARRIKEMDQLT